MAQQYDKDAIRKVTLLQFALLGVLFLAALVLYYVLVAAPDGSWVGLVPPVSHAAMWLWLIPGCTIPILVFSVFWKLVPSTSYLYDENVRTLADLYSLKFMVGYFLVNAFVEELMFRGALQSSIGLLPAAILFTLVHFSYYKKPLMLLEVFVLGLFFGWLFAMTESLWITTIAHAYYNWILMWLIKTGRIEYGKECLE